MLFKYESKIPRLRHEKDKTKCLVYKKCKRTYKIIDFCITRDKKFGVLLEEDATHILDLDTSQVVKELLGANH